MKSAQQIHDEQLAQRIREAWAILERLVNQNIYDDIGKIINSFNYTHSITKY